MILPFNPVPQPRSCPWGQIDHAEQIAPGIWSVSTPSHGGLILSAQRLAFMPLALRYVEPFTRIAGAYEEDCDACIPVVAYPEEFSADQVARAREVFASWIAPKMDPRDAVAYCPGKVLP